MELQQEYQQLESQKQENTDYHIDRDISREEEAKIHDDFVNTEASKNFMPLIENAHNTLQDIVNETQQFIKNKFTRLDDVFFKREAKRVYIKKEDVGNPTAGSHLDTQRWNVKYHIEWNWGLWHNYNIVAKDGKDTYKIVIHHNEPDNYDMKVSVNNKPAEPGQSQKIATKYIWLL